MPTQSIQRTCACPCGEAVFHTDTTPFARFYCHCLICQKLYGRPFADVSVLWARHLHQPAAEKILIARYRRPPALDRATCDACGKPVFGILKLGPLQTLAFVPTANLAADAPLPASAAHIFYHRRVVEHDDDLPKFSGYWRSEAAVAWLLSKRMFST